MYVHVHAWQHALNESIYYGGGVGRLGYLLMAVADLDAECTSKAAIANATKMTTVSFTTLQSHGRFFCLVYCNGCHTFPGVAMEIIRFL